MLGISLLMLISDIRGKIMRYWIIVFCLVVGCTSANLQSSYAYDLEKWIGYPENELFNAWGMPDRMFYVTANEKVVTYLSTTSKSVNMPYGQQIYYSGIDGGSKWWNSLFGPPLPKQPDIYYCKISFIIRNGVVSNFNFNGDNCIIKNAV